MLDVRFLGEQRIVAEGDADPRAVSARSVELLAYLVAHAGVPQERHVLASVLWPDSEETQSRTNLRRELHNLKSAIRNDASLEVRSSTLTWRDLPTCRVDVRAFESARGEAAAAHATGDATTWLARADEAISWYHGDFLPGLLDEWVLTTRSRLLRACVDLCDDVVAEHRARGDLVSALHYAHLRVQLLPIEELGHRTLMELQIERGDRAAAMSTYHRLAELLERELDVGPDPETSAILDDLLHRTGTSPAAALAVPGLTRRSGVPEAALVGRVRELDQLVGCWRGADAGARGAVVVYGEPGVGKTRLVAELAGFAASEGAVVASSRCFGESGRLALAPVADWLRSPAIGPRLSTLDPVWRAEVRRLVPVQGGTVPPLAPPPSDDLDVAQPEVDSWARLRFFEGLARAVLHSDRPTLLVLDDLQWCDQETVAWLTFLLEFAREARLLVAATARPGSMGANHGVASTIRTLRTSGILTEVELSPLGAADAATLVERLTGRTLSSPDGGILHAATGGYPLFIVEAAQRLPSEGATDPIRLEADVTGVLRHRLEETSEEAQGVASLAAAVGRDFSLDLLVEASDLDSDVLVDAVDELWRCRILVEHRGGYDFSHDLLREAAYASVSTARRWLLHRRLAQGLELLYAGHTDEVAAQLADQYRKGGRPDRALPYYRRAADVAAALYANAEAVRQHERCLELVCELPEGPDRDARELDVLQAMSAPLNALQGYAAPRLQATLERSVSLAERLDRPDVLVRNLVGLFSVRFVQGYTAEAHEFAARALALSSDDPELAGQAHFAFAGSATSLGMLRLAVEHFDLAITMSPDRVPLVFGTRPEVHSQAWSAHATWLLGGEADAAARAADAVGLGRRADQPYSLAVALAYAAITDQLRGDVEALRRDVAELRSLCRRHEFAYYAEWGLILDGWATGGGRGIAKIRLGVSSLRGQGAYARMPYWLSLLGDALSREGEVEESRAVLDAALVGAEQRDDRWWLPEVLRARAALDAGPGAEAFLAKGLAVATEQSSVVLARRCEADLAARRVRHAGPPRERLANA